MYFPSLFFKAGWDSSLFWTSTPLSRRHLWVLSIPLNTSVALFTLSSTWPRLFLSIPYWMTLRALAKFSSFLLCSLRSWRTSFHPKSHPSPLSPQLLILNPYIFVTSASCVEERVGIVRNGCTLGPESYSSSLKPNLRLAGPGIHGRTWLARTNTSCDTCVQYALPDQGPVGAGSWSRMTHHLGRARLTSASPPRGPWTPRGMPQGNDFSQALTDSFSAPLPGKYILLHAWG